MKKRKMSKLSRIEKALLNLAFLIERGDGDQYQVQKANLDILCIELIEEPADPLNSPKHGARPRKVLRKQYSGGDRR